jgi:uncharacterized protein YciI
MAHYVVEWVFGPDQERRLSVRAEHRAYVRGLIDRGVVLAAGPWEDQTGALLVYAVDDLAELQKVLDEDPYTEAKVLTETKIREWQIVGWSSKPGQ